VFVLVGQSAELECGWLGWAACGFELTTPPLNIHWPWVAE
jgi:hypothetical protein